VSDLVEFLRSRLDEDEEIARRNMSPIRPRQGKWQFVTDSGMQVRDADGDHLIVTHTWPNEGEHIARYDPARILAEVDAKRQIIDLCVAEIDSGTDGAVTADSVLYLLALPYADHPDYRAEWATGAIADQAAVTTS
jgi:Family of unknown function (DUF6221)